MINLKVVVQYNVHVPEMNSILAPTMLDLYNKIIQIIQS